MVAPTRVRKFDVRSFLESGSVENETVEFPPNAVIYRQGDPAEAVMYLRKGRVKLSVVSGGGKEAVLGVLGRGDFFGEGCLAGQSVRMGSVTAMIATTVLVIGKEQMSRLLHDQPELSNLFIAYMLARNIRIEEDLVDQLFNSSEKRLARILLLLARYGKQEDAQRVIPKVSQEVLAEMVGTTRSRVNFFMNKFRKLGFIEYNGELKIHDSLMSVVLHD
jgi:CRP/FNR family transcriptional regulator, cyclic AMP receptor protein